MRTGVSLYSLHVSAVTRTGSNTGEAVGTVAVPAACSFRASANTSANLARARRHLARPAFEDSWVQFAWLSILDILCSLGCCVVLTGRTLPGSASAVKAR